MFSKKEDSLEKDMKNDVINIEDLYSDLKNQDLEIRIYRNKLFSAILYLVNMIERDCYTIKIQDINLSNLDVYAKEDRFVLHKTDYKLAYLVPVNKKMLVSNYIDMLFTRHDNKKNVEKILNDDLLKLNINNNNYVILSYFKEDDEPYITYKSGDKVTYDATNKYRKDSKIKIVDSKFNYIYEYLDLVYGYVMSTQSKKVSYKELKTLALYYATNYMNKNNDICVKKIGQKI